MQRGRGHLGRHVPRPPTPPIHAGPGGSSHLLPFGSGLSLALRALVILKEARNLNLYAEFPGLKHWHLNRKDCLSQRQHGCGLDWPGSHRVTDPALVEVLTFGALVRRGAVALGAEPRVGLVPRGCWKSTGGQAASMGLCRCRVGGPGSVFPSCFIVQGIAVPSIPR